MADPYESAGRGAGAQYTSPNAVPGAGPTGFDLGAYTTALQRMQDNPGDEAAKQAAYEQIAQWSRTARRIPGGDPGVVTLPGRDEFYNPTGLHLDPEQVDPTTRALGRYTQGHWQGVPTVAGSGGPGVFQSRGYRLRGGMTPEEAQAAQRVIGGDESAAPGLAQTLGPRWEARPLSGMQQFAQRYYIPAIEAAPAIAAGIAAPGASAPLLAGMFGAMAAGEQTRYRNPGALALGAAGGAAAGYGGSALSGALGAGPVASGAITGASGAAGGELGREVAGGDVDPGAVARAGAIGGAGGAATGGARVVGAPPVVGSLAGNVARQAAGTVLPGDVQRRRLAQFTQPTFAPTNERNDSLARWTFRNTPSFNSGR